VSVGKGAIGLMCHITKNFAISYISFLD
jgi:hypothetical protein